MCARLNLAASGKPCVKWFGSGYFIVWESSSLEDSKREPDDIVDFWGIETLANMLAFQAVKCSKSTRWRERTLSARAPGLSVTSGARPGTVFELNIGTQFNFHTHLSVPLSQTTSPKR